MKVKELIIELQAMDPEMEIILQGDPEGNDYHECRGSDLCYYDKTEGLLALEFYSDKSEAEADLDAENIITGCVIYP
jgi:hypothetical protein